MAATCRKLLMALIAAVPLASWAGDTYYYGDRGYGTYDYGYNYPYYGSTYGPSTGHGQEYYYDRDRREWRDRRGRAVRIDPRVDPVPLDVHGLPDWDGPGPGKWERDGNGNLNYAPDGGKDARDANSASPG